MQHTPTDIQVMPDKAKKNPQTANELPIIKGTFASTYDEIVENKAVFGRLTGTSYDGYLVDHEIPYKNRNNLRILRLKYEIPPGTYTLLTGENHDIPIEFVIPKPGEIKDEQPETPNRHTKGQESSTEQLFKDRCALLEGYLNDAERQNRNQDGEISKLRRELSQDRTQVYLTHQKELTDAKDHFRSEVERLKENHRKEIRDLEQTIRENEQTIFKMELEERSGRGGGVNRLVDLVEKNIEDIFPIVMTMMQQQGGGQAQQGQPPFTPQEPSPQQLEEMERIWKNGQQKDQQPKPGQNENAPHEGASPLKNEGKQSYEHRLSGRKNGHSQPQVEL